jgi:hypothetical protein
MFLLSTSVHQIGVNIKSPPGGVKKASAKSGVKKASAKK